MRKFLILAFAGALLSGCLAKKATPYTYYELKYQQKSCIQAGIKRVVYGEKYRLDDGLRLLERAGIEVIYLNVETSETP